MKTLTKTQENNLKKYCETIRPKKPIVKHVAEVIYMSENGFSISQIKNYLFNTYNISVASKTIVKVLKENQKSKKTIEEKTNIVTDDSSAELEKRLNFFTKGA